MAKSNLDVLVNLKNNASGGIKQVAKDLKGLQSSAGGAGGGVDALAGSLGGLAAKALGPVAALLTLKEAVDYLGHSVSVAFEFAAVEQSYASLADGIGVSNDKMLLAMREVSRGMIADYDLMLSANKAMMLGVADTTEEMVGLMEVAIKRGQAMGLDAAQAFDDIITGIGRNSPQILDNLGFKFDADAIYEEYAESIGKAADKLTDFEKKQALVNAVLADTAGTADIAVNPLTQLKVATQNFTASLGTLLIEALPLIPVLETLTDLFNKLNDAITLSDQEALLKSLDIQGAVLEEIAKKIDNAEIQLTVAYASGDANKIKEANEHLTILQGTIEAVGNEYNKTAKKAGVATVDIEALNRGVIEFVPSGEAFSQVAGDIAAALGVLAREARFAKDDVLNLGIAALAAADNFNALLGIERRIRSATAGGASKLVDELGATGALAFMDIENEKASRQVDLWKEQGFTIEEINGVLLPAYLAQLDDGVKALDLSSQATKSLGSAAKETNQEFENLKNTIRGVLDAALDPGVGVDPDEVLERLGFPREDAINENARRLADIAQNGLKDQEWLGEFRREVPDVWKGIASAMDPQEEAARILKEFQMGLRPELIDKEKAKELVRAMIVGDQNMSALATEIATELAAEMGVSVHEAEMAAKSALGVTDVGQRGAESAQAFKDGALDANAGATFIDGFVAQMKAVYDRIKTAGQDAGTQWGTGFLATVGDNVPMALVSMLVDLVTPGVMLNLARNQSMVEPQ